MPWSRLLLALSILALGSAAAAEAPPSPEGGGEPAASAPKLTRPPELLQFVEAPYPKEAEAARIVGAVGLLVDIDETGAVTRVEVVEPAGHGFDEAAAEALRRFRFSPAEIDGKPAPVRIAYRYAFVLKPEEPRPEEKKSVVNFRGQAVQRGTREPIPHANVSLDDGAFGAETDAQGRFEIAGVPPGKHRVAVTAPGHDRFETEEQVDEGKATEVTYYVRKLLYGQYETVIRGKRERKEVAQVELQQEEIRLIPGTQGDAFKVVQNLPGVARSPYGFGLLVVRGGRPNDTRVYLDGVWIPLIFHFGGLTSVFNSDLLSDITFQPGNFGSQFGRASAGVVEGKTRAPSSQGYHGYLNVNLIDTSALVEGPVAEGWSFAGAGRVSYVDLVLEQFLPDTVSFVSAPRYFDYQARLVRKVEGSRDQLRLSAYGSNDSMKLLLENPALVDPEGRADLGTTLGFHRLVGAWTHTFSPQLKNDLSVAPGVDTSHVSAGQDISADVTTWSLQLRDALSWELHPKAKLELGADVQLGRYYSEAVTPSIPLPGEIPDPIASRQLVHHLENGNILEPALYAEAVLEPFEGTRLVPGLRFDYEYGLRYVTLDPRLSAFQKLGERTTLKGGVGLYQQPPDFRFGQWTEKLGNPDLGPEKSLQTMLGVERKFGESITLDVQLYYKRLYDLVYNSPRKVERDGQLVLERYANVGDGRAYGAEILLRHDLTRNFFGWIAYSISRSERRSLLWEDPAYRLSPFDQPHHLVVVASYKWPGDWITGARLQYASGNLTTPLVSTIYDADGDLYVPLPGRFNSERMPGFLSLDLRVDKRFVFQQWMVAAYLDVQNVTNAENAEFLIYNYDFTKNQRIRGLPIFPTLGVKAEF